VKLVNAHPETLEPAGQWVKQGACKDDPDAMYPGSSDAEIDDAKAVCGNCPVIQQCRQWALETREPFGVWGGMSEAERRGLLRQAARRNLTPEEVKAGQTRRPTTPRTLRGIFDANTTRLPGGHLAWTGPKKVSFHGRTYTPKQVCFIADRGHHPDGQVTSDCGITECVLPRHLLDTGERTRWAASVKASA
jgi:WhiB family redox-sensing transcriptional regulator